MSVTSVRLQEELEAPLEGLAEKLHRSKNWLINQAIREFLDRQQLEDARWKDTLEALESVKAGKAMAEDDVHAWLESWGQPNERKRPK